MKECQTKSSNIGAVHKLRNALPGVSLKRYSSYCRYNRSELRRGAERVKFQK